MKKKVEDRLKRSESQKRVAVPFTETKKKWKGIGLGPAPCPSSPAPSPLSPAPASPTSTLSTNFIHLNNFKTKSATEKKGRKIEAKNKKKSNIFKK